MAWGGLRGACIDDGGGDGVDGGGVEAADETVDVALDADWTVCRGRRGMGSLDELLTA